ncbi:hypothetical protein O0L34_g11378 [Tuta absoluta]|nr:hypothetical protein O0L34_g11378 [Tuta absoluta]
MRRPKRTEPRVQIQIGGSHTRNCENRIVEGRTSASSVPSTPERNSVHIPNNVHSSNKVHSANNIHSASNVHPANSVHSTNSVHSVNDVHSANNAVPLPLCDSNSFDWAALVHTATRAMLQICEEHQYPSIDNPDPSLDALATDPPVHDSWSDVPTSDTTPPTVPALPAAGSPAAATATNNAGANCGCGLAARVAALETDAARTLTHQHQLEEEVRRLRRHNARLREESARAVWQLRQFTQWLKRTVDRQ